MYFLFLIIPIMNIVATWLKNTCWLPDKGGREKLFSGGPLLRWYTQWWSSGTRGKIQDKEAKTNRMSKLEMPRKHHHMIIKFSSMTLQKKKQLHKNGLNLKSFSLYLQLWKA